MFFSVLRNALKKSKARFLLDIESVLILVYFVSTLTLSLIFKIFALENYERNFKMEYNISKLKKITFGVLAKGRQY